MHRYVLPDIQWEGWAIIVLGSDGYFSAVSDYGNYSFLWTHHGHKDFREFFIRMKDNWDYFVNKLSPEPGGRVFDEEATIREIKSSILKQRRTGALERDEAREEWELVSDFGSYDVWYTNTNLEYPQEYYQRKWDPACKAFVEKVLMARLQPILAAELAKEKRLRDRKLAYGRTKTTSIRERKARSVM